MSAAQRLRCPPSHHCMNYLSFLSHGFIPHSFFLSRTHLALCSRAFILSPLPGESLYLITVSTNCLRHQDSQILTDNILAQLSKDRNFGAGNISAPPFHRSVHLPKLEIENFYRDLKYQPFWDVFEATTD